MAGPEAQFDAEFNLLGGEDDVLRITRLLEESLERAFARASDSFQADMKRVLNNLSGRGTGRGGFDDLGRSTGKFNDQVLKVERSLEAMQKRVRGLENNFKDAFDTDQFAQVNRQVDHLADLADVAADKLGRMTIEQRKQLELSRAIASSGGHLDVAAGQIAVNELRRQADVQIAEQRRITRENDRASKERIVQAQQEGAITLASMRAASQKRVALIQLAAQQIRAAERGLGAVFRGTADAIGASFRGLGGVLTNSLSRSTSTIRQQTTTINNELTRNFSTSLEKRESLLSRSFRSQERTLQSSVNRQITQLDRLETRVSSGVLGAATGRSAAANAIGFGGISAIAGGAGLAGLLTSGFQRFSDLERLNKQFLALTGNMDTTATLMAQIKDFAAITPFDLVGVADLAKGFLAMGTAAEDVLPQVKTIADAVALTGGGTDELTRIQRAIGQVVSAGRLQGDELNQLAENLPGLNIRQILADQLTGGDTAALVQMQEAGELSADSFVTALMAGLGGDPRLQGAAEALATTLSGRFANLKEQFSDFGASIIGLVAEPTAKAFALVSTGLQNVSQFIKGEELTPFLENLRVAAAGAAAALGGLIIAKTAGEALQILALGVKAVLTPLGLFVTIVAGVGAAVAVLARNSPAFAEALRNTGEILSTAFGVVKDVAGSVFSTVTEALGLSINSLAEFGDFLAEKLTGVNEVLGRFVNERLRPILEGIVGFVKDTAIPALKTAFGAVAGFVSDILVPGILTAFNFVKDNVVPVIADFAVKLADGVVASFRFIRDKVIPVVADLAVVIAGYAVDAGKAIGEFALDVADFAKANDELFGVLGGAAAGFAAAGPLGAGLGASIGLLATNFEHVVPLIEPAIEAIERFAKIVGSRGLGEAFANLGRGLLESLGNIGSKIQDVLGNVWEAIQDFFAPKRLKRLAFNFLDLVEEIGRIIGSIATNPKFVAGVAAVVGAFVGAVATIVFRFGEGLIRGIRQNLDRWVRLAFQGLGKALEEVFKFAVSDNRLILVLGGALVGAKLLGLFRTSGQQAGQSFQQGMQGALKSNLFGGALSGGGALAGSSGSASIFIKSLFGGPDAIAAEANKVGAAANRALAAQRNTLIAAGVSLGDGSRHAIQSAYQKLEQEIGPAGRAGLRMRSAIQQTFNSVFSVIAGAGSGAGQAVGALTSSIGNVLQTAVGNVLALFRTNPQLGEFKSVAQVAGENAGTGLREGLRNSLATVRDGFKPLRDALVQLSQEKSFAQIGLAIGKALATGVAAGFAGFATGRAVGRSGSGIDILLGVVGITATTLGVTGNPIIAGVAGAATAIGAAFGVAGKAAEDAAAQIREYTDALEGARTPTDKLSAVVAAVNQNLKKESPEAIRLLGDLGFGVEEFSQAALDGEPAVREYIAALIDDLGPGGARIAEKLRDGSLSVADFNDKVQGGVGIFSDMTDEVKALVGDYDIFIDAMDIVSDESGEVGKAVSNITAILNVQHSSWAEAEGAANRYADGVGIVAGAAAGAAQKVGTSMVDIVSASGSAAAAIGALGSNAAAGGAQIDIISAAASQAQTSFEDTEEAAKSLEEQVDDAKQAIFDFFDTDYSDSVTGLLNDLAIAIPEFGDAIVANFQDPEISQRVREATEQQLNDAFREDIEQKVTAILEDPDFVITDLESFVAGARQEIQTALNSGEIDANTATRLNMIVASVVDDPEFRTKLQQFLDLQAQNNPMETDVAVTVRAKLQPEILTPEERKRRIRSAIESGRDAAGNPIGRGTGPAMGFASGAGGGAPEISIDVPVGVNPQIVGANLPAVGSGLVAQIAGGVAASVGVLTTAFGNVLNATLSAITQYAPLLRQIGVAFTTHIAQGVAAGAGILAATLNKMLNAIFLAIPQYAPLLRSIGIRLAADIAGGFGSAAGVVSNTVSKVLGGAFVGIQQYGPFLHVVGGNLARFFAAGLASQYQFVLNAGLGLGNYAYQGALAFTKGMYNVGVNIGYAMAQGIYSTVNQIAKASAYLVTTAINAAQGVAKIKSPSLVFIEMGEFMGQGLAIGISDSVANVKSAASQLASDAISVVTAVNSASQQPLVTGADVRGMVEASGGTTSTNVTLVVEGNIYGDAALDAKLSETMNQIGQVVAARPRHARAAG